MASPFPEPLRRALIARFQWEVSFSIDNGEIAIARGEQTHIAGCVYRALCCLAQVLFALNRRYLINEKGALDEAATFPIAITGLRDRVANIWRAIGRSDFDAALADLRMLDSELGSLATSER